MFQVQYWSISRNLFQ